MWRQAANPVGDLFFFAFRAGHFYNSRMVHVGIGYDVVLPLDKSHRGN
jgi:hypothetical protein